MPISLPRRWLILFSLSYFLIYGTSATASEAQVVGNLSLESKFNSLEDFRAAVNAFLPAQAKGESKDLFSIEQPGQPEEPTTGPLVPATKIESCTLIWSDETTAVAFALARPPTKATPSAIGVLFLLKKNQMHWEIAQIKKFSALGKYAQLECKQTAWKVSTPVERQEVVLSVTKTEGGRGGGCQQSASYQITSDRFKLVELD